MTDNIDFHKFHDGIRMILHNWPLLRGAVDIKFNEYCPRYIKSLNTYFDTKQYQFANLSNEDLEKIFVKELSEYILEWEVVQQDIEDFMLIFVNEVFDCMPHKDDKDHEFASRYIMKLNGDIMKNDDIIYEEIKEYHKKNGGALKFVNNMEKDEDDDDDDKMDEEDNCSVEATKLNDEDKQDLKKKKKKNKNLVDVEIDEEDLPQFQPDNNDSDDDWVDT